mmetsp:Transcript_33246/g.106063  ORF Transcript_33246/g.106063 Transcript_33246/m.106063 type:complete len:82 (-) Transcript_33246:53-298(-)
MCVARAETAGCRTRDRAGASFFLVETQVRESWAHTPHIHDLLHAAARTCYMPRRCARSLQKCEMVTQNRVNQSGELVIVCV